MQRLEEQSAQRRESERAQMLREAKKELAALVLLTVIPLIPAKKYHDRRISEKKAEGGK